jgi:hypothetical protein
VTSTTIPNRLVFVWFGSTLPITASIAIRSAVRWCRPDEVLLVHEGLSSAQPEVAALLDLPGLRLADAGPDWFDGIAQAATLRALWAELEAPAARSNVLRLAVLFRLGGIYLDTDTICVRDLAPLRRHPGFCGTEVLALPADLANSRNPLRWVAAGARVGVRAALARTPGGQRLFSRLTAVYPKAVNNAVLGASAGNALIGEAFARIEEISPAQRLRRFRLGTHLLQELTGNRSGPAMHVLAPEAFYPLGPEISMHWFRRDSAEHLGELVGPRTFVVHWYSSLEKNLAKPISASWIREDVERTAFAALAREYV